MTKFKIRGLPTCQRCSATFDKIISLTEHLYEHANIYVCMICRKSFKTKQNLTIHKTKCGMFSYSYMCPKCYIVFNKQWKLVRHKRVHVDAKFKCYICDISFKYVKVYDDHVLLHMKK